MKTMIQIATRRQQHLAFLAITWLLVTLLLSACQSTSEPLASGYEYQPLEKGNYWIYEVTEQRFLLNGTSTTQTFQLRETITNSFTDPASDKPSGGTAFRIERYRRTNDSQAGNPTP
jgi:hypothetical protein